jgi:hypothetical protein
VIVFDDFDIPSWAFGTTVVLTALAVLVFGWWCLLWYIERNRDKVTRE